MNATQKVLFFALQILCAANAQAQEIYAASYLSPANGNEAFPKISLAGSGLTFIQASPGKWQYVFEEKTKIFQNVNVDIDEKPVGYTYEELTLRIPLLSGYPTRVYVFAVKANDTNKRIEELYSMPIAPAQNGISKLESLFELFQETGFIALARLNAVKTRTANVYDAKIFYTHLQITRQLGRTGNLKVPQTATKVADQLRTWMQTEDGKKFLKKSLTVGIVNVDTLVSDIDLVEAEQLRQMWNEINIKHGSHSKDSCTFYNPFLTTLTQDYDVGERQMWRSRNKDYDLESIVVEAIRLCVDKAKTSATANGVAPDPAAIEATSKAVRDALQGKAFLGSNNPEVQKIVRSLDIKF